MDLTFPQASALAGGTSAIDAYYAREAQKHSEAFQEKMFQTRYQNTVNDLRAAGLNPILALGKGVGSSSPSVGIGKVTNTAQGLASAAAMRLTNAQAKKLEAETSAINAKAKIGEDVGSLYDSVKKAVKSFLGDPYNNTNARDVGGMPRELTKEQQDKLSTLGYLKYKSQSRWLPYTDPVTGKSGYKKIPKITNVQRGKLLRDKAKKVKPHNISDFRKWKGKRK